MKAKLLPLALFSVLLILQRVVGGQVPDQLKHSFINPNTSPQAGTHLGSSVAMDGDYTVVGAPGVSYQEGFPGGGAVNVFRTSTGALLFTILGPNKDHSGRIGAAVAISGSLVAACARRSGDNFYGAVFIYDLASSRPTLPVAVLPNPLPRGEDNFGYSVAISGTRVAVGEYVENSLLGKAWVFDLASATPTVPVLALENRASSFSSFRATAVALSGGKLVVGVSIDPDETGPGWAYVYDMDGGTPTVPVLRLEKPGPATENRFAHAVAISGPRVVISDIGDRIGGFYDAGSAYVFDIGGSTPTIPIAVMHNPAPANREFFGQSVAIADQWVVVGTPEVVAGTPDASTGGSRAGIAYAYDVTSNTPNVPVATLQKTVPAFGDTFGSAVAISGNRAAVGAPHDDAISSNAGSTFLFDLASANPSAPISVLNSPSPPVYGSFGLRVAISGTLMAAAAGGEVDVYRLGSAAPTVPIAMLRHPHPNPGGSSFGPVAISGDRLVVNAQNLYVYDFSAGVPTAPAQVIAPPASGSFDRFFNPMAIDGARVVVAGFLRRDRSESLAVVFVYDLSSSDPGMPVAVLKDPEDNSYFTEFGSEVAISGSRVLVANIFPAAPTFGVNGRAYVYDLNSATPTLPSWSIDSSDLSGAYFAYAIAISGTRAAIADPGTGKTYLYELSSQTPTIPAYTFDQVGLSVAISGTRIVIGNEYESFGAYSSGGAHVFDLRSPTPLREVALLKIRLQLSATDSGFRWQSTAQRSWWARPMTGLPVTHKEPPMSSARRLTRDGKWRS